MLLRQASAPTAEYTSLRDGRLLFSYAIVRLQRQLCKLDCVRLVYK